MKKGQLANSLQIPFVHTVYYRQCNSGEPCLFCQCGLPSYISEQAPSHTQALFSALFSASPSSAKFKKPHRRSHQPLLRARCMGSSIASCEYQVRCWAAVLRLREQHTVSDHPSGTAPVVTYLLTKYVCTVQLHLPVVCSRCSCHLTFLAGVQISF